ncbi:MAG: Arc family DNA-binding protein [Anaerolineae bacterium]|nr:Arc family DNA-binding protein [Anaerolineae bacterium]MDW8099073.1 Arc family DNA-binding protein [Anaerolineae bacterium]
MATVTIKNIPPDLYERLKQLAKANRHSINSEIIACIERAVQSRKINLDEMLATARALHQKTATHPISDEEFTQAKVEGRS